MAYSRNKSNRQYQFFDEESKEKYIKKDSGFYFRSKYYKSLKDFCKRQHIAFEYVKKYSKKNKLTLENAAKEIAIRVHGLTNW